MAKEIERKFLITRLPPSVIEKHTALPIQQGYITNDPSGQQVRVRSKGNTYYLTVKGRGDLEREEVETELSVEQFDTLWPLTAGRRLMKRRYKIPYQEHCIELDVFEGELSGLVMAEIEFGSVEESARLKLPAWFGKELTYDHRFTNSQLASDGRIPLDS